MREHTGDDERDGRFKLSVKGLKVMLTKAGGVPRAALDEEHDVLNGADEDESAALASLVPKYVPRMIQRMFRMSQDDLRALYDDLSDDNDNQCSSQQVGGRSSRTMGQLVRPN